MKVKRNLSGLYFRVKNDETGKFESICFEDLSTEQQDEIMNKNSQDWVEFLAKHLADTLNEIGNQFDIANE